MLKDAWVYLDDDTFIKAKSFGADKTEVADVVINSSMCGIQEIVTDPKNSGVFLNLALTEVGVYGANEEDMNSPNVTCKGVLVREYSPEYSNFRATMSLGELLKRDNAMGICGIDTRYITRGIAKNKIKKMVISTQISDKQELKQYLHSCK